MMGADDASRDLREGSSGVFPLLSEHLASFCDQEVLVTGAAGVGGIGVGAEGKV